MIKLFIKGFKLSQKNPLFCRNMSWDTQDSMKTSHIKWGHKPIFASQNWAQMNLVMSWIHVHFLSFARVQRSSKLVKSLWHLSKKVQGALQKTTLSFFQGAWKTRCLCVVWEIVGAICLHVFMLNIFVKEREVVGARTFQYRFHVEF